MVFLKIYAILSCVIGAMQIADGVVLVSAANVSPKVAQLFGFYGAFGAFGLAELCWLAISTVAAALFIRRNLPYIPPVCFVVFCLLHPIVGMLIPAAAFTNDPASGVARVAPAVIDIVFGVLYLVLNCISYKSYFFVPRLFEK